jgi:hypothetical protein
MILNENYYNTLINKYSIQEDCNKTVCLSTSIILGNYGSRNVYFNFPKGYDLREITNFLYENLSKQIFTKHADITGYSVGDKLKRIKEKGKNIYKITEINGNSYVLTKEKDSSNLKITANFDSLKLNFKEIQQNARNSTLSKFDEFFKNINEYNFTPQHFSKKLVLIAGQTMWSNLKNRNCIPSIYLPNTREGEQTVRKSIEALEDCITYVTPKYEVCYEEILKKNITVDAIVICDTDLNSLSQIISDQSKYHFKLIVLSNENDVKPINGITLWNWQREEIELMENKSSTTIDVDCVKDSELDALMLHFEECMQFVSTLEISIKLKSYGYFLRLALSVLQKEQFDYLLMRLKSNKELERNEGGYEDFAEYNPKDALKNLILYLKEHNSKYSNLSKIMSHITKNTLIVADREDADLFKSTKNSKCKVVTNAELKKLLKNGETYSKTIIFYSFNGAKDFDFIYNLPNNVQLVLYKQEKELYYKQLQSHTKQLETEFTSGDRYKICGVKYEPIVKEEIKVSPTLEQIIERLEQRSSTAYDGYKNESDSLLDDLEEQINYNISFSDNSTIDLESNETVFDAKGSLVKSYKLKIGNKIRIYPKEKLAEDLLQVAIEVEPDKFGKIDEHANAWQSALKDLDRTANREQLYKRLKNNGLRVLPATVDAYFRGNRKFPMFNSDLRAILKVAGKEIMFEQIKKSKRLYNSTMIALGRGVKQELQQFLQDKTVGDILQKKSFTKETLQKFIDDYMPLLTITKMEEVNDEQ